MKHFLHILIAFFGIALCSCSSAPSVPTEAEGVCVLCSAQMQNLPQPDSLECALCGQQEMGTLCCTEGHYICSSCRQMGFDSVVSYCLGTFSTDPIEILEHLMDMPTCRMHGPEHHVLGGVALLAAYHNAGGEVDLQKAIPLMVRRGKAVPGAACGNYGACGAAIGAGTFLSIITDNSPFATDAWHLSNQMTSEALCSVCKHGGPRCCKRDSYLSLLEAVRFCREHLGVEMDSHEVVCSRSSLNRECLGAKCPFFPTNHNK